MQSRFKIHIVAFALFSAVLRPSAQAELMLYVGNANFDLERFNATTGAFVDHFASGFAGQSSMALSPDGRFFVAQWGYLGPVRQFDATTGAYVGDFVPSTFSGSTILFGPDGDLYAAYGGSGFPGLEPTSVRRYNGLTGGLLNTFIPSGSGGLFAPSGMKFGPDGNFYIGNMNGADGSFEVLKFDGQNGNSLGTFIPNVSTSDMQGPGDLLFGPDGNLYVSVFVENVVRRYNGITGAYIDDFASDGGLLAPLGLAFGPDGNLYVASSWSSSILRYDGTTGEFIDKFANTSEGPSYLLFADTATVPEPAVSVFTVGALVVLLRHSKNRKLEINK